jgi:putative SOS response-associated peptidase YedK
MDNNNHLRMCNRYQQAHMQEAKDALAAIIETPFNVGSDIMHPKSPGLVVRQHNGHRILASMTWGFPLILADMKARALAKGVAVKPKPVNNARTDKLRSGFWSKWTDPAHRCLIPVKAYAEAIGTKGSMTEAWMTVPTNSVFAVAGIWRPSAEWGDCYSMIITEAAGNAAKVHNRMPVIISKDDYEGWMQQPISEAIALCVPWTGLLSVERTDRLWART